MRAGMQWASGNHLLQSALALALESPTLLSPPFIPARQTHMTRQKRAHRAGERSLVTVVSEGSAVGCGTGPQQCTSSEIRR